MNFPKGNPLFEKVKMPFTDVNILLNNLEQQGFTGYAKLEMSKVEGLLFYVQGSCVRAVEMDDNMVRVHPKARILNRIKNKDINVSVYVFSHRISEVLSQLFAFQPLYLDYSIKQKEWRKVMGTLEEDSYTGLIETSSREGISYLVVDKGELVTDFFASHYGQIISGTEAVSKYLDLISKYGSTINVFVEKQEEIDTKVGEIDEDMDKIRQLLVKEDRGFSIFKSSDIFYVDEVLFHEWGFYNEKSIMLELETHDGQLHQVKAQSTKKMAGYISIGSGNIKKFELTPGEPVSVKPLK